MKTSSRLTLILKRTLPVLALLATMPVTAGLKSQQQSHLHEKQLDITSLKEMVFQQNSQLKPNYWTISNEQHGSLIYGQDLSIFTTSKNSTYIESNKQAANIASILPASEFTGSITKPSTTQTANEIAISPVPIPATAVLFGTALTGFIGYSRRRNGYRVLLPAKDLPVMGLNLPVVDKEQTLNLFQEWISSKTAHQVFFANVHNVVSCLKDKELLSISNNSHNAIDGLPLVWYAKLVHNAHNISRVSGPDIMLECLDKGRIRKWKHFFLGGTEPVLNKLAYCMEKRFPGVDIVGIYSPPFRPLTDQEDDELVALINAVQPDFLWVGLGAPKQEKWIAAHLGRVHAPIQLGVGAAFNFHSGEVKRAPLWMQKIGFEWLYRMLKEKRLIKRYLATNPVFLLLFLRDFVLVRILRIKPM